MKLFIVLSNKNNNTNQTKYGVEKKHVLRRYTKSLNNYILIPVLYTY